MLLNWFPFINFSWPSVRHISWKKIYIYTHTFLILEKKCMYWISEYIFWRYANQYSGSLLMAYLLYPWYQSRSSRKTKLVRYLSAYQSSMYLYTYLYIYLLRYQGERFISRNCILGLWDLVSHKTAGRTGMLKTLW